MSHRGKLLIMSLVVAACGRSHAPPPSAAASGDSLVPIADAAAPGDTLNTGATATTPPPPPAPAPVVHHATPKPRHPAAGAPSQAAESAPTHREPAPAPAPRAVVAAGTTIEATAIDSIHSHVDQVGDSVRVSVAHDVADNGRVVIPAGSVVTLVIDDIAPVRSSGARPHLALSARSVEIDGTAYPLEATVTDYEYEMKARGVGAGEVAKTGAGAVAGGILGRLIGGNKTGTIVGAAAGAAAGAAVAAKTVDRDVVVHAGSALTLTVGREFSR